MNDEDIKLTIIKHVIKCNQNARKIYNMPYKHYDVSFFEKGVSAGFAHRNLILSFNLNYARQDINFILDEIVPHEVAHLIAYELTGKLSHDNQWKEICIELGGNGESTFERNVKPIVARKMKRYEYVCGGIRSMLTSQAHKKMQSGNYSMLLENRTFRKEHFTGNVLTNV